MIVMYVDQATGEIRKYVDAGPSDIAIQPIPANTVPVVASQYPNITEDRVVGIKRRPDLDLPDAAVGFYEGTIQKRRTTTDGKNRKKSR